MSYVQYLCSLCHMICTSTSLSQLAFHYVNFASGSAHPSVLLHSCFINQNHLMLHEHIYTLSLPCGFH